MYIISDDSTQGRFGLANLIGNHIKRQQRKSKKDGKNAGDEEDVADEEDDEPLSTDEEDSEGKDDTVEEPAA